MLSVIVCRYPWQTALTGLEFGKRNGERFVCETWRR